MNLKPKRDNYLHGRGSDCSKPKLVIASWKYVVVGKRNEPVNFVFDAIFSDDPKVLGLDVLSHGSVHFQSTPPFIAFERPEDDKQHTFTIYFDR